MKKILLLATLLSCSIAMANTQSFNFQYLNDVLTSASPIGVVKNAFNSQFLPKYYSLAISTTASGYEVDLEGSLDGVNNWTKIVSNTGISAVNSSSNVLPMLFLRLHEVSVSTTAVTATAIGVP